MQSRQIVISLLNKAYKYTFESLVLYIISIVKGKLVDQRFHIKDAPIPLVSELPVKSLGRWYNASFKDTDQSDQLREEPSKAWSA